MKLATIKPNALAIVKNETLIPISETLERDGTLAKGSSMIDLIGKYDAIKNKLVDLAGKGPGLPGAFVPAKPVNYFS